MDYLHNHKDFPALLNIVAQEMGIQPLLVEKDYWIMHVLYGLQQLNFTFELKGGTSLSKGYKIIHRFSEDIDIHITPPAELKINENPKNNNPRNIQARKQFYDWLAATIKMDGILAATRETEFDDVPAYRSGGIRLNYPSYSEPNAGIKEGILLEAGFDKVTPNNTLTISSWAYEKAVQQKVAIIDNRGVAIPCYHPGYTFVEKLQTIATKFRLEQETEQERPNLLRQYYDIYSLVKNPIVKEFIGTADYFKHKADRFPDIDNNIPIRENEAFLLSNPELRKRFEIRFQKTAALYYDGQPDFEEMIEEIGKWLDLL